MGMTLLELRKIVADLLNESDAFDNVLPLGNVVYVHSGDVEYEVVLRTVRGDSIKPITRPDQRDGPVAQE